MLCVYQFKMVLRGISPMIWRRLLLRSDHSIADLHYTIQRVGAGMHAHPLLREPEMAQDALDDILLVDERNDAHFP